MTDTTAFAHASGRKEGEGGSSYREHWEKEFKSEVANRTAAPTYVQWISTNKCNFRCAHCGTAAADQAADELTTAEIKKQLDALAELGTKYFSITGGEPLVRDDMFEVMYYAKDVGIEPGFVTNGYEVQNVADKLVKLEPLSILVSIDGYKETHNKIRGVPGAYDRCMKALEVLRDSGTKVVGVSSIILKENLDDAPKILDDAFAHGCTHARLQTLVSEGRAKGRENTKEEIMRALEIVWEARHDKGYKVDASEGMGFLGPLEPHVRSFKFFCGCGYTTFTIMRNGNVMGCPAIEFPAMSEGNVREKPLKDIWWDGFQKFRDTLYADLPQKCQDCEYKAACAGGCWLLRVNGRSCFIEEAKEFAEQKGVKW